MFVDWICGCWFWTKIQHSNTECLCLEPRKLCTMDKSIEWSCVCVCDHQENKVARISLNLEIRYIVELFWSFSHAVTRAQDYRSPFQNSFHFAMLWLNVCVSVLSRVQLFCNPMNCSPPDFSGNPLDFPGKNTGVGCRFLFQGIFLTQGSNSCLLHILRLNKYLYHPAALNIMCLMSVQFSSVQSLSH